MILKKHVIIFALMILTVFLSVSGISAMDVNTVDSNSTVLTANNETDGAVISSSDFNDDVIEESNIAVDNEDDIVKESNIAVDNEDDIVKESNIATNNSVIGDNNQKTVNLDAPSIEMYYKNGTRFTINLTDGSGNGLANQSVNIVINGVSYTKTTDNYGLASMGINLYSGSYNVSVTYKGTNEYSSVSTTSTINILPTISANDITKFYKNGTQYYATFIDGQGRLLANTNVTFNINGVFYTRTTNDNGVARLNINLNPNTYVLTAYNPNDGYEYANTIKVLPTIVSNDLSKLYLDGNQFYATFYGSDGTPLANTNVTFNINGVFYTRTTNDNGVARLNINLYPNTYVLTAYNPNDDYNIGYTITVANEVNTIIQTQSYNFSDSDNKVVSIVLYDQFNHTVSNQKVSVEVGGSTYNSTTDSNGIAKFIINLATAGTYNANYIFNQNGGYLASGASNTITVYDGKEVILTPNANVIFKDTAFSVLVEDVNSNLVINKNVYFTINGVNYTRATNENGVASITIRLNPNVYNISYTLYDTGYKKTTGSTLLSVITTNTTVISGDNIEVGKGAAQKFNVSLTAGGVPLVNKNVIINVNGVNYTRTTNNNGIASLTIGLDVGTYYITYSFKGDSILSSSNGSAYCIVKDRKTSSLTVSGDTVFTKNSSDSFKVLLADGDGNPIVGGNVIFTLNGVNYTRTTGSDGIASLAINLGTVGQYEISYAFEGNNNYLACSDGCLITVTQYLDNGNGYWVFGGDMYNVDLANLAALGTGNIFLNFYAFTKFDQSSVLSWIKQANSYGIKVHIWMQAFYEGGWLSPLNSDGSINTDLFNSKIEEAKKYASLSGVAGVHIDYLRYPGTAYKHSGGTEAISEFVKQITEAIRSVNSNCIISAAVMPEKNDAYYYGQDIATISKYLDIIVPMVYKGNYNSGTSWISSITQWFVETSNGAAVWVGLQAYKSDSNTTKLSASELLNDAQTAYDAGATGTMIFRWGVTNFIDFTTLDIDDTNPTSGESLSVNSILGAAESVKKSIEDNGVLPRHIIVGKSEYTMPQFLYLMARATNGIGNNDLKEIMSILVNNPSTTSGDDMNKQLSKSEFVSLANTLADYISTNGIAPASISSTLGNIKYESLIYAYARTLAFYQSNSALPNFVFVTNLLDDYALTVTMKVSVGGTSYNSNVLYTTVWLNFCPQCNYYGTLLVNPKGTAEGELTCAYCDCDYCGVSGNEKVTSPTRTLTRLTESIPESSGGVGDSISINDILSSSKTLKTYIQSNHVLPDYVILNDEQYTLSQFLYLMSNAIVNINEGNLENISVVGVASPSTPGGDTITSNINKTEYLDLVSRICQFITTNEQAPNYASSSVGKISYGELFDAFSRILAFYSDNSKTLPKTVLIDNIMDSGSSQAVINKAKSLVDELNSTRDMADALFKFVRDEIKYGAYGTGALYYNTVYGAEGTLIKGYGNCCDQAQLLVAMARAVGLTARFATGYCVFSSGLNIGHVWVQFNIDGQWVVADPTSTRNSLGVINNWNTNSYIDRGTYDVLPY